MTDDEISSTMGASACVSTERPIRASLNIDSTACRAAAQIFRARNSSSDALTRGAGKSWPVDAASNSDSLRA